MEGNDVEACQVTIERKVTIGLPSKAYVSFNAMATGPRGQYIAASTSPVRVKGAGDAQFHAIQAALTAITQNLTADGWRVVPGAGQHVMMGRLFLPSFQRLIKDTP